MRFGNVVTAAAVAMALLLSGAVQAAIIDRGDGMLYDDVLEITWLQDANYTATELTDARRDAIITAVNAASPAWLGSHTMTASDFVSTAADTYTGMMTWWGAMAWAEELSYGGYDDWRLPTMHAGTYSCVFEYGGTDCGYNVRTYDSGTDTVYSELAYMYHDNLGLKSWYNPDGTVRTDYGIFGNGTYNGTDHSSYGQNDVGLIDNLQAHVYWSGMEYAPDADLYRAWNFSMNFGRQTIYEKERYQYAWAVRTGDVPEPATLGLLGLGLGALGWSRRQRA